jgi:hypothetical protein
MIPIAPTNKDDIDDVVSIGKLEEIGGTTGEYALWINVRGC